MREGSAEQLDEAVEYLQKAITLDEVKKVFNSDTYTSLGRAYDKQNKFTEAIECFEKAIMNANFKQKRGNKGIGDKKKI